MKKIKKALISVSDKKNLKDLLKNLTKYKIELISSGGTFKEIRRLQFKCLEVSEYTGSPEVLGGRVKTLHPKIHAGILSKRKNKSHCKDLKNNNFEEIDLVIVNFYPFEKILEQTNNHFKIIENFNCEEGNFILIKNNENIKKIIGIIPINSDSIYSINETFKIEDFTNKTTHFIHETLIIEKKPIIVCDEQGGILCLHKDYNKSGFISRIIKCY